MTAMTVTKQREILGDLEDLDIIDVMFSGNTLLVLNDYDMDVVEQYALARDLDIEIEHKE